MTLTGHCTICCTNLVAASDSHLDCLKRNNSNAEKFAPKILVRAIENEYVHPVASGIADSLALNADPAPCYLACSVASDACDPANSIQLARARRKLLQVGRFCAGFARICKSSVAKSSRFPFAICPVHADFNRLLGHPVDHGVALHKQMATAPGVGQQAASRIEAGCAIIFL